MECTFWKYKDFEGLTICLELEEVLKPEMLKAQRPKIWINFQENDTRILLSSQLRVDWYPFL